MMRSLLIFAWLVTGTSVAWAQPVELELQDAIDLALAESHEARDIQLERLRAEQLQRAAAGQFRTNAELLLTTPDFAERFTETIDPLTGTTSYFSRRRTRWSGDLNVNQPLPTNGLLTLRGNLEQIDTEVLDSDQVSTSNFFTSISLNFSQPLFVPNSLQRNLERADLQLERSQMQFTRTQLDIIYGVTDGFYALYRTTRALEIARAEVEQQQRSYELARVKFEAGLIPEVEALQMEVDLAQSRANLLAAQGSLDRTEDSFKLLLGLESEENVSVLADLEVRDFEIDEQLAIEHGLRHRAEIREGEISRRLAEISLEETDARRTIRGDLRAFYDITGTSDPTLGFGTSTLDLFDSSLSDLRERPNNKGLAFSLTLPLWDSGVNGAEVAAARLSLERSVMQQEQERRIVVQQIRSALIQATESREQLRVLTKSEELAQRSYEISLARFQNGEITTQDLALDRERLTQARLAYLDAYIAYRLASADLERQTLYDFAAGKSLVGE